MSAHEGAGMEAQLAELPRPNPAQALAMDPRDPAAFETQPLGVVTDSQIDALASPRGSTQSPKEPGKTGAGSVDDLEERIESLRILGSNSAMGRGWCRLRKKLARLPVVPAFPRAPASCLILSCQSVGSFNGGSCCWWRSHACDATSRSQPGRAFRRWFIDVLGRP